MLNKLLSRFLKLLSSSSRKTKLSILILFDSVLVILILFLSFYVRLGFLSLPNDKLLFSIYIAPIISIPIFYSYNFYRSVIRYIGFKSLVAIFQAVTLYSLAWGLFTYMISISESGISFFPRSVIFINWAMCLIFLISSRVLVKWLFDRDKNNNFNERHNIAIYGVGSSGRQVSLALQKSNTFNHVAFVDDNKSIQNSYVNGIKVYSFSQIQYLIDKKNITEIFLTLPSISRKQRINKVKEIEKFQIICRNLPSVSNFVEGKVKIDDLLQIDIGDLLGRKSVSPNTNLLKIKIKDKIVLVTGAGGSIGSELCRQIVNLNPKKLVLFDSSESSLYQIDYELTSLNINKIEIFPVLGSVRDFSRIRKIINYYGVQTIYHAAAYKHVPIVEYNQSQGVLNNSIGTLRTAEAAIAEKVETFVLISTDKAVRPSSTMGASKRVAELVLQALAKQDHKTCLTMVRFGNVLDSSGSVIPLFKKQIKQGGPITVTDINMVRYFMTIQEAVELVIQAGAMGKGGDVFVLDMGEPVRIYDLAVNMIHLSGLQVLDENNPDGDIEIKYTGIRPGEKLYEELLVGSDVSSTENKLIMCANEQMINWSTLKPILNELNDASIEAETEKIKAILCRIIPEFESEI
jgi:FlaA1/EpsC-like NDP-sugar epimerase